MTSKTHGYYEYLPEGYDPNNATTYPLILCMTGIGELGNGTSNLPLVVKWGVPHEINIGTFPKSFTVGGEVFRFLVIAPQFIKYPTPTVQDMDDVLNYIVAHYKVDLNRIYITGLSYGGGLSFAYAGASATNAQRIAAIVPVASPIPDGGDSTIYARSRVIAANNVPVWATHNRYDSDDTVATTISYINDINQSPAPTPAARITIFSANGHNAWSRTYNPALKEFGGLNVYEWMLQYKRNIVAATNKPPTAAAGADQTITLPANSITLNGSGTDADGTIAAYSWTKVSGPASGAIASASASSTTVTGLVQGTYVFRLTVTDNKGATATDDVSIVVNAAPNMAPQAAAGIDQTITLPQSSATVKGSGTDSDGSIVSYNWTKISGPAGGAITTPSAATTAITALQKGSYVFRLTVTDNDGASATDDIAIIVNAAPNVAPQAEAGTDQMLTLPANTVSLNGLATDGDGSITNYAWTKISGPSAGSITNQSSAATTVTGLVAGTYIFRLTVTDNDGATAFDDIKVTVNTAANKAPVASAGIDIVVTLPVNHVDLKGSGTDADGTIASYLWTQVSGPAGGVIVTKDAAAIAVTNLLAGSYIFRLMVTDNDGATDFDEVQVTVTAAPNQAPVADAGADITITLPMNAVTLSGRGTDADGAVALYAWTKISGPAQGVIATAAAAQTSLTNLVEGIYTFRLTVTDNDGAAASDDVTVTVKAAPANKAPTANAGADQSIILPTDSTTLTGTGADADGNIKSYSWTKVSGPVGGIITLPNAASIAITALQQGSYVFRLTVTDNNGATASDDVAVVVTVVTAVDNPATTDFYIRIAQNPSVTQFSLKVITQSAKPVYLRVTDGLGRVVDEQKNLPRATTVFIGAAYKPGIYYAEIVQGGNRRLVKLLKIQ